MADLKFLTDGMLGKLTRWLRMLGHDVVYAGSTDDKELILEARKKKRILLTRDVKLYQQAIAKRAEAFLLESPNQIENLAKVAKRFGFKLELDVKVSRCPKCNTRIKPVKKADVMKVVPEKTLTYYDEFWQCPKCLQVYWRGTHWKKIEKTLAEAWQTR